MPAAPLAQGKVERGKVYSGDGVLGYLEMLEAQAHELGLKQEEKEQQEKKLDRLKARVQELRARRDELRAKVELQEKRLLDKEGVMADPAQPSAQTVLEWKVKSLKAMLQVFYLTGISGKLTKQGVCFCISTAYEGTYLDSYYVDLLIKPLVKIQRHSVPVFIPLEQIAKKYLQDRHQALPVCPFGPPERLRWAEAPGRPVGGALFRPHRWNFAEEFFV